MHARKTPKLTGTPALGALGAALDSGAVPTLHREQIVQAGQLIDEALRLVAQVQHSYALNDARCRELTSVLTRGDMVLFALDGWLTVHQARG